MPKHEEMEFELEEENDERSSGANEKKRVKRKVKAPTASKPKVAPKPPEVKKGQRLSPMNEVDVHGDDEDVESQTDESVKKVQIGRKGTKQEPRRIHKIPKKKHDEGEEIEPEKEEDEGISLEKEKGKLDTEEGAEDSEIFEEEIFEEEVPEKPKVAKKMAVDDSIKRRLLRDSREIQKLKEQIMKLKIEMQGFENEVEYVEKEMEKVRSEKEEMEEEINKKTAIINALEKKLNRTQKDFDGYKGRIHQEIERKAILKMKGMVLGVIEIIDNFDRALSEGRKLGGDPTVDKLIDGMESIRKNHLKLLQDHSIVIIEPGEEQFDPNLHEAVDSMNDPSRKDNTIIRVDTSGYMLEGKVLRPARVIVSKGGPPWPKKNTPERTKPKEDSENAEEDGSKSEIEELEELEEMMDSEDES